MAVPQLIEITEARLRKVRISAAITHPIKISVIPAAQNVNEDNMFILKVMPVLHSCIRKIFKIILTFDKCQQSFHLIAMGAIQTLLTKHCLLLKAAFF